MPVKPRYMEIAEELRDAVAGGVYPPGSRLPGENRVMSAYGVQRATARQALGKLVEWGIAEARKGSGTYVRDFRPIIREGIRRLGGETWPAGQSIWSAETEGRSLAVDQIEVTETADVPAPVRALLLIGGGEAAARRSRRFVLDAKPVLLAVSWVPASIAGGTRIMERDTGPGGLYARLAEVGRAPVRFREDLRSAMPGQGIAERLAMAPGTPVVEIVRTAYDGGGSPVEVNEMTADASAYVFRYEFDA